MLQVSSKLDQSAVVWHSSLTMRDRNDLERVQKSALRVILGEKYISYKNALNVMRMDSLEIRRQNICLKFAKQCIRNEKLRDIFPRNKSNHSMEKRNGERFVVKKALTERYKRSAIPNMQRLLNNNEREKMMIFRKIKNAVPVNYELL